MPFSANVPIPRKTFTWKTQAATGDEHTVKSFSHKLVSELSDTLVSSLENTANPFSLDEPNTTDAFTVVEPDA